MVKEKIMLDPSLFVANYVVGRTFRFIEEINERFEIFISKSFSAHLYNNDRKTSLTAFDYFLQSALPTSLHYLTNRLHQTDNTVKLFAPNEDQRMKYEWIYNKLGIDRYFWSHKYSTEQEDLVRRILFEQYIFLHENSWLLSRNKSVFNSFKRAGAAVLEIGKDNLEYVVRKTLKIKDDELLNKYHVFGAAAKWIGVAGPTMHYYFHPNEFPIAGIFSGILILLVDP